MTTDSPLDQETLDRMRAGDPLAGDRHTGADAETETALRIMLAQIDQEHGRRPATPRREMPRRGLALGAVGVLAVAGTLAAVDLAPTGHGELARTLNRSGVAIAPARAATLDRARRALALAPGDILEVEDEMTGSKGGSDPTFSQTIHYWEQAGGSHDNVIESTSQGVMSVVGEHDDQLEYYDSTSDTIGVMTPTPAVEAAQGITPRAKALALIRRPGVRVDHDARYDGQPAVELTSTQDGFVTRMYLQPGNYTPLAYLQDASSQAPSGERGAFLHERFVVYRTLAGSAADPALVSLAAQHPHATIIHQSSAAWNETEARLDP